MVVIPVAAVPSQTLAVTLAAQPAQIALRTLGDNLYLDLIVRGVAIVTTRICRNQQRLLLDVIYRGFLGDLMFVDTQGETDPVYTGMGTRYQLVYLNAGE